MSKKGKKPNTRGVAPNSDDGVSAQGNQWQASTRQLDWLNYYMNPREVETYRKAYHSAIKAGYSETYAKQIMSPTLALQWVKSAKNIMATMNTEHIRSLLEDIAADRSEKTADRIAAAKLVGIDQGMFVQKQMVGITTMEEVLNGLE